MEVNVNWLAVVLAAAATMVVGAIWYARGVFGSTWIKLAKLDPKHMEKSGMMPMLTTFIVTLLSAFVLAHVTYLAHHFFGGSFLQNALSTAFWVWAGFTAARIITHDAFEGRPVKLTVLTIAHEFVTFMAMALVIGLLPPAL